ncbi:MAG: galactose mutarotase [Oscillospiraceae bacterium]|nr:galactose mutarotase [Oscillospiraceae bacterium]
MASIKLFGEVNNKPVYLIKLNNGHIEAEFISLGATIRALRVPDRSGNMVDVCLGYDTAEEYMTNDGYIGATVGRNANRISGSKFSINGKEYKLNANEGENQLHGGIEGFSHKCWNFSCTENSVTFSIESPDGDEGYPGNLKAAATFSLVNSTLRIDYSASCDKDTIVNLTNHAYFNLSGQGSGAINKQLLTLGAESYTPCRDGNIPTGEFAPIINTPLDFSKENSLDFALTSLSGTSTEGIDHNFVLSSSPAATLYSEETGIELSCKTSLEGLQVYTSGFLTKRNGKDGAIYGKHHGICLETQHFPDAINNPHFPSPIIRVGEEYKEWTEYSFKIR